MRCSSNWIGHRISNPGIGVQVLGDAPQKLKVVMECIVKLIESVDWEFITYCTWVWEQIRPRI